MTTTQATQTDSIVYHVLTLFHDIPHYSHTLGIFTDVKRASRLKDKIASAIRDSESVKNHLGDYRVCLEVISIPQEDIDKVLHTEYTDYIKMHPARDVFMELALKAPDSHSWFGNLLRRELEFQEKRNSIVVCDGYNAKGTQTHRPIMNVVTHVSRNMAKCAVVGIFMSTLTAQRVQESLLYYHGMDVRFGTYNEHNFVELECFYEIDPKCVQPDYIGLKHLFTT